MYFGSSAESPELANSLGKSLLQISDGHKKVEAYLGSRLNLGTQANRNLIQVMEESLPENRRVLLLFSGGKDSSLLAKILTRSNKVLAVYLGPEEREPKVAQLANNLGIDDFVSISNLATPDEVVRAFKKKSVSGVPIGGNSLLGLSILNSEGLLNEIDEVVHGQGADTLSGSMHNQIVYASRTNQRVIVGKNRIATLGHFASMARRVNRLWTLRYLLEIERGFNAIIKNWHLLTPRQIQILIGRYYTFVPIDGGTINQFQDIWGKPVSSPFHSNAALDFFMLNAPLGQTSQKKPYIEKALKELGISELEFESKGFGLKPPNLKVTKQAYNYQLRKFFWSKFVNSLVGKGDDA